MALIAVSFTVEIILLIVALYFGFDSGILRKIVSIGFCFFGLPLVLAPQVYISDLTATPISVSVKFPGVIQNAMSILFILTAAVIIAAALIDILKMNKLSTEKDKDKQSEWIEYIV
jgi:multisubunit Na+/H+ antiporter MnhC subunit